MKRIICAIAVCLLLCGCGASSAETGKTAPRPAVEPTEPSGSYRPESEIEAATDGAIREYPQQLGNIWSIQTAGDDLLVFSDGETTKITRLTGENLFRIAEIRLDKHYSRFYAGEEQVIYYDSETRELVYLNRDLREIRRMDMPQDMLGEPVLTGDRMRMYYCTSSGVRCLDMESGISRLVKEMTFALQYMTDIHMGDTVLQVEVMDERGNRENLFLDANTGALLGSLPEDMTLASSADYFYAIDPEGVVAQTIFGTGQEVWQLKPADYLDSGIFLPEIHGAVVFDRGSDGLILDYFDLSTGLRIASVNPGDMDVANFSADAEGYLYFVGNHEGGQSICRWDLQKETTGDEENYVGTRYTFDVPDAEGLEQCRGYAEELGQRFGVEIRLITEATDLSPADYDLIPEYQVPVIMDGLRQLETMLAQYPEGIFEKSVEDLEAGQLTLLLVRGIRGSYASGDLEYTNGLHFWQENQSYVAIAMGADFQSTCYHEIFHALETRLLSRSIACYRWDELNPRDFDYDYDYIANRDRDGSQYLEDTTRSFIDTFSMSYPKEDRAMVMEYACLPGKDQYFISYTMQKKLRALCEGIREAYDLEDYPEALLWERYLESPIYP